MTLPSAATQTVTLVVRRTIGASAEKLFAAWTEPTQLREWWGPEGVLCPNAEVDLRVGGQYRIANQMPDGQILWIVGAFEAIEPARRLVYSWRLEPGPPASERVTVEFQPRGQSTEVTVTHERIEGEAMRDQHQTGWIGCLEGLARFVER